MMSFSPLRFFSNKMAARLFHTDYDTYRNDHSQQFAGKSVTFQVGYKAGFERATERFLATKEITPVIIAALNAPHLLEAQKPALAERIRYQMRSYREAIAMLPDNPIIRVDYALGVTKGKQTAELFYQDCLTAINQP